MSKYLTGHQVIATLNIEAFELLAFAKKGVLRPFTPTGKPVRDIQEERTLINSEEHRLDTLNLKRGEFEVGMVFTRSGGNISWHDRERKRAELEAEITKLEGKGIRRMSYQQIKEKLAQHLPCVWESFDLPMNEIKALELIRKFQSFFYLVSEVEKLTEVKPVNDISISRESNLAWDDITIMVISDVELFIQWPNGSVTRSYELLGFKDQRTGKPITAWASMLNAAEKGQIPWTFETRKKVEKYAQTLRQKFRDLFPEVPGEPIPINSKKSAFEFSFHLKPPIE
jgi:hypothetical protein